MMIKIWGLLCLAAVCYGRGVPRLSPLFPNGRIVGGEEVDISKVPYQLALEWNGMYYGGASLITETFALTAGHCVLGFWADELKVRAGSNDLQSGGTLVQVKKTYLIDEYFFGTIYADFDVGLLELVAPLTLGPTIATIPLTDAGVEPTEGSVVASGWGHTVENGTMAEKLHWVIMPVVPRAVCEENYSGWVNITASMFCAGEEGKESCQGDSGGAIVQDGVQMGIVSWGRGCAQAGWPGVYANVAHPTIRAFIRKVSGV